MQVRETQTGAALRPLLKEVTLVATTTPSKTAWFATNDASGFLAEATMAAAMV